MLSVFYNKEEAYIVEYTDPSQMATWRVYFHNLMKTKIHISHSDIRIKHSQKLDFKKHFGGLERWLRG